MDATRPQGTTYRSVRSNAAPSKTFTLSDPIDSDRGQARITASAHDPKSYAPALVPGVRPYCYGCGRRVPSDGCAKYLSSVNQLGNATQGDAGQDHR